MIHLRLVVPASLHDDVLNVLTADPAVVHLAIIGDTVHTPAGGVVLCDVPREAANEVLRKLRALDLHVHGAIVLDHSPAVFSAAATTAEATAPGDPSEAVVWEEVKAKVRADSVLTVSWVALLSVAILIAAVGLLTDSAILIVGAMVVGPDYGPVAAAAIGLHLNQLVWIRRGVRVLAVGFTVAIPTAFVLAAAVDALGGTPDVFESNAIVATRFISHPDGFAVIVAALAGVAGVLSLTQEKAGTLVGVLISVTTVPAAAAVGVYAAHQRWGDAAGSLGQLMLNLVILAAVGGATLRVERWAHVRRVRRH
jgi:uncharacterized hydrophobic protein (TIGR00271 family)